MLKSSGAMAAATLLSRVLGMVREIVYARFMGDGWVAGAFQFAFTIPNLFRRLLGEGALTAAFIPIFKEKEKIHGEREMWRAANAVISGLVIPSEGRLLFGAQGSKHAFEDAGARSARVKRQVSQHVCFGSTSKPSLAPPGLSAVGEFCTCCWQEFCTCCSTAKLAQREQRNGPGAVPQRRQL